MIRPTRMTQPYRQGPRRPSGALSAMLAGRDMQGGNPQDVARQTQQMSAAARRLAHFGMLFDRHRM